MTREDILQPLTDWYASGAENYSDFLEILGATYDSAFAAGQAEMRERAATEVAGFSSPDNDYTAEVYISQLSIKGENE